jgi:cell division protein FtsW
MKFTTLHADMMQAEDRAAMDLHAKVQSDRGLLTAVIALMVFGLLAVYSAISYFATSKGLTPENLVFKHLSKVAITFVAIIFISKVDYRKLLRWSGLTLIFFWALLIYLHFFGESIFGARRWLTVGGLTIQPSTWASMALILRVAYMLASKQEYIKSARAFTALMFWIGITCALIALQDFSTAGILFGICLIMLFVGRLNLKFITAVVLIGALGASAAVLSSPERISRVENYVQQVVNIPDDQILVNEGYQAQQAQIAIARGELLGVGIGKSAQRDFLPAPYNDFIFAIIAEEYELMGAMALLMIYCFILFRGFVVAAKKAADLEGALLALGCTLMITLYAFVNAAVATGLLPVTGLPMPFVSYGGTNMLVAGLLIGTILNISKQIKAEKSSTHVYSSKFKTGYVNG